MTSSLTLESVQIGEAKYSPAGSKDETAIDKQPVDGAVIGELGVMGDTISDTEHHGGPDQAVYVYFRDDYDYWQGELGYVPDGGRFGENLTIAGMSCMDVAVGDRFEIRDVVLEAAGARIPCAVFTHHMAESDWIARFREARRMGVYCRVLSGGAVAAGDDVGYVAGGSSLTMPDYQDLYYDLGTPTEQLEAALEAPIAIRMRDVIDGRLARR